MQDMRGNPNVHPSRRFGHVSDPDGHLITPVHHMPGMRAAMAAPLPNTVDWRPQVMAGPGINDQLRTSSCVGQAIQGSVETRLVILGRTIKRRSAFCVYDGARCIDRTPNADGSLDPLTDDGSMPNQGWRSVSLWGICPYEDRPTSDATVNDEPNMAELQDAHSFRLGGAYGITDDGDARTQRLKQLLAAGILVNVATFADTGFQNYVPSRGPLSKPNRNDPTGGGHDIYLAGYDVTRISGHTIFFAINSWGKDDWGIEGTAEVDEGFTTDLTDLYAADVQILGADGLPMRSAA